MSFTCVIDASVAVALYLADSSSEKADALFAHLAARRPAVFHVPDLFFAECLSVLRKHLLRYGYAHVDRDVDRLHGLSLRVTPCIDLLRNAADVSLAAGISAYDAFYVSLSQRLEAPLVSNDHRLLRAMAGQPYDVQPLSDFDIPPLK